MAAALYPEFERRETERTGVGLMFWAARSSDLDVVKGLLASFSPAERLSHTNSQLKQDYPHLFIEKGFSLLSCAMAVPKAGFEFLVQCLLDAHADPSVRLRGRSGLQPFGCGCVFPGNDPQKLVLIKEGSGRRRL